MLKKPSFTVMPSPQRMRVPDSAVVDHAHAHVDVDDIAGNVEHHLQLAVDVDRAPLSHLDPATAASSTGTILVDGSSTPDSSALEEGSQSSPPLHQATPDRTTAPSPPRQRMDQQPSGLAPFPFVLATPPRNTERAATRGSSESGSTESLSTTAAELSEAVSPPRKGVEPACPAADKAVVRPASPPCAEADTSAAGSSAAAVAEAAVAEAAAVSTPAAAARSSTPATDDVVSDVDAADSRAASVNHADRTALPAPPPRRRVTIDEGATLVVELPALDADDDRETTNLPEETRIHERPPSTNTTTLSAAVVGRFMAFLSTLSRLLRMIKAVRRPAVAITQRAKRLRMLQATRHLWRTLLRYLIAVASMIARRSRVVFRRGPSIAWRR